MTPRLHMDSQVTPEILAYLVSLSPAENRPESTPDSPFSRRLSWEAICATNSESGNAGNGVTYEFCSFA